MREKVVVPRLAYPWATIPSPRTDGFLDEETEWLDRDYREMLGDDGVRRWISQEITRVAAYMAPTVDSVEVMRPTARFIVYETVFDDHYGMTPIEKFAPIRDRVFSVMRGDDNPRPGDPGILRQMATGRDEFLAAGMPQFWVERMALSFWQFTTWGIMPEWTYRTTGTCPPLDLFLEVRAYSIGQQAYGLLAELSSGFTVPENLYHHPVVTRIRHLQAIIIAIQNDMASIGKEVARDSETFNIMFVLRDQYGISLQEAAAKTLEIANGYIAELDRLVSPLPDFGPHRQGMETWAHHMVLQITGLDAWYWTSGTTRYQPSGFLVAEHGEDDEDDGPASVEITWADPEPWPPAQSRPMSR